MPCPDRQILSDYRLGRLAGPAAKRIGEHLSRCLDCRRFVAGQPPRLGTAGAVTISGPPISGASISGRAISAQGNAALPSEDRPLSNSGGVHARGAGHAPHRAGLTGTVEFDRVSSHDDVSSRQADRAADGIAPGDRAIPPELAKLNDYEVLREIGHGAMGVVFLARHRVLDRLEVLKLVMSGSLSRRETQERFQEEMRAVARLAHPNVVRAYGVLRAGDRMALVMEHVPGETVAQSLLAHGRLPVVDSVRFAQQVALGLSHAWKHGLTHRDIKPSNLILQESAPGAKPRDRVVKILDFGLAKIEREQATAIQDSEREGSEPDRSEPDRSGQNSSGQSRSEQRRFLGTPDYVAPEQITSAADVDIRADIYSLGATLYHMLSGVAPFAGRDLRDLLHAHQHAEPAPLNEHPAGVPAGLAAVVAKMMAKHPADRYQTPDDVVAALEPYAGQGARRRWKAASAVAAGLLLTAALATAWRRADAITSPWVVRTTDESPVCLLLRSPEEGMRENLTRAAEVLQTMARGKGSELDPLGEFNRQMADKLWLPSGTRVELLGEPGVADPADESKLQIDLKGGLTERLASLAGSANVNVRVLEGTAKGKEGWVARARVRREPAFLSP